MDKIMALENIKSIWNDKSVDLGYKIENISNNFYSCGLDLVSTATYIKSTPSELDALLSMSGLEEDLIERISKVNPPKTTWTMLANANYEEIDEALKAMEATVNKSISFSELVYKSIIDISGPSPKQKINLLSASEIKYIRVKGEQYSKLTNKEVNFLKSLASRKGKGLALTVNQIAWFISILNNLVDADVISKNSRDDDQEICDKILDCLGR